MGKKTTLNSGSWYQHLIKRRPIIIIEPAPIINFEVTSDFLEAHPIFWVSTIDVARPQLLLQVTSLDAIIIPKPLGFAVENLDQELEPPTLQVEGEDGLAPPDLFSVERCP